MLWRAALAGLMTAGAAAEDCPASGPHSGTCTASLLQQHSVMHKRSSGGHSGVPPPGGARAQVPPPAVRAPPLRLERGRHGAESAAAGSTSTHHRSAHSITWHDWNGDHASPLKVRELSSPDYSKSLVDSGSYANADDNVDQLFAYGVTGSALFGCCAFAAAIIGFISDGVGRWRYLARFELCRKQLRRVQEIAISPKCDEIVCPVCIEMVSCTPAIDTVGFLCGHRFHTACANHWYDTNACLSGHCPICDSCQQRDGQPNESTASSCAGADGSGENTRDETALFCLRSIARQFPELVTEERVCQWSKQHANASVWLSELECPQYRSIFMSMTSSK